MTTPEFLKPRLRLFLSADIVGSTALKQSRLGALSDGDAGKHGAWFPVIQGFYLEARRAFLSEWSRQQATQDAPPECFGDPPTPWKTVGDEVLFVKVVTDFRQVAVTLACWIRALQTMREFVRREDPRLDVKCTSWLAGFPFANKEVVLPSHFEDGPVEDYFLESGKLLNRHYADPQASRISVDYVGPSIDIGFRLAGLASSRKFVVSIDVAYILSLRTAALSSVVARHPLFYDGAVELKGVFAGARYPVFWIDVGDGRLSRLEDALTDRRPCQRDAVIDYCDEFYSAYAAYTFRPFIDSRTGTQPTTRPEWYDRVHGNLVKNFVDSVSPMAPPPEVAEGREPPAPPEFDALLEGLLSDLRRADARATDPDTTRPRSENRSFAARPEAAP